RATALALCEGSDALALPHLERRALSDAKCARMAADIQEGEQALHSYEEHRQRLLALLGMSDLPSLTSGTAMHSPPVQRWRARARAGSEGRRAGHLPSREEAHHGHAASVPTAAAYLAVVSRRSPAHQRLYPE